MNKFKEFLKKMLENLEKEDEKKCSCPECSCNDHEFPEEAVDILEEILDTGLVVSEEVVFFPKKLLDDLVKAVYGSLDVFGDLDE